MSSLELTPELIASCCKTFLTDEELAFVLATLGRHAAAVAGVLNERLDQKFTLRQVAEWVLQACQEVSSYT